MPKFRRFLLLGLLAASSVWLAVATQTAERQLLIPEVRAVARSPYQEPTLSNYHAVQQLTRRGDLGALEAFVAEAPPSFLRYRTMLELARHPRVPLAQRADYYALVVDAQLLEPLARDDVRRAYLEYARAAEQAGSRQRAIDAYVRAFPLDEAVSGVTRLEPRSRARAQLFLQLGAYAQALEALEESELDAPLLEARSYRGLGELEAALAAYDRLLDRAPTHQEAQAERAWVLLALSRPADAARAFSSLPEPVSSYGLGAVAAERGDFAAAAAHYRRYARESGDAEGLWLATEMLETTGDLPAALTLYLELARQTSRYQGDAAYRALVLAERLGNDDLAQEASALLPEGSYFSVLRSGLPAVPSASSQANHTPDAVQLSAALVRAGDREAALGELAFALGRAEREDEATTVALAEALQTLGEFRRSSQAAGRWLEAGSRDLRTWRAAYPRAYRAEVEASTTRWGVDPALVWAVMRQESGFYPRAVSTSEARGLMQVIPSTWEWLAELLGEPAADPFGVADNIRYGSFYLQRLEREFGGDLERTVAAYNGGPGYIGGVYSSERVAGDPDAFYRFIGRHETREYLQKVMYNHAVYSALYPRATGESVADTLR